MLLPLIACAHFVDTLLRDCLLLVLQPSNLFAKSCVLGLEFCYAQPVRLIWDGGGRDYWCWLWCSGCLAQLNLELAHLDTHRFALVVELVVVDLV